MQTFIVVPAYNEEAMIESVVAELLSLNYNVIVVDDGSLHPIVFSFQHSSLFLLRHKVNLGQGAALQTGIEFALFKKAQLIVTFDADSQHHAADIAVLTAKLVAEKLDIVLGSRFLNKGCTIPAKRKYLLQIARLVNFLFTGLLLTDAHNGLRAMTHSAAQKIKLRENRMAHATELLWQIKKHKLRYAEVPVLITYSPYSQQKGQTVWDSFRIVFDLLLNKIFQ